MRKTYPDNENILLGEARALLGIGDPEGAKTNAFILIERNQKKSQAQEVLAQVAEHTPEPQKKIDLLRSIIWGMDDADREPKMRRLMRLLQFEMHQSESDPLKFPMQNIQGDLDKAVMLDPLNVSFRLYRGQALATAGRIGAAKAEYRFVLDKLNPYNRRAFVGLFQACVADQKYDEALDYLKKSNEYNPTNPYLHYYLAQLALERGEYDEAYKEIERLEREGARGAVYTLLYHGLAPTDYADVLPARIFREHMVSLKTAGFRFMTPDEVVQYFAKQPEPPLETQRTPLRRYWNFLKKAFRSDLLGGKTPAMESASLLDDYRPPKLVCVTFDDATRSSFTFGTPVADELDLRFAMCVPVGNILTYDPSMASWEELKAFQATGRWIMGSHSMDAHIAKPIDAEGNKRLALPNALWQPDKGRIESLSEYTQRIIREFQVSRRTIQEKLGLKTNECNFIAYPYGDVGQDNGSNVRDVISKILLEADQQYSLGFIQSDFGFAVKGDNSLLYKRHEPREYDTGQAVVDAAYREHPVFLARSLRAKAAARQGRPLVATHMLDLMRRDGCSYRVLDETHKYVETHMAGRLGDLTAQQQIDMKQAPWHFALKRPYLGAGAQLQQDNQESQSTDYHLRAGLEITPKIGLEVRGGIGSYKHTTAVYTNWTVGGTQVYTNTSTSISNGVPSTITQTGVNSTIVPTNTTIKTVLEADIQNIGGGVSYRFDSGALFSAQVFQRSYTSSSVPTNSIGEHFVNKLNNTSFLGFSVEFNGRPTLVTEGNFRFTRDAIPTFGGPLAYNAISFEGRWNIRDYVELVGSGEFQDISDGNSLFFVRLKNLWRLSEEQQIYSGIAAEYINAGFYDIEYWTPHWLERVLFVSEIRRNYLETDFRFGLRYGMGRQAAWPADELRYNAHVTADAAAGQTYNGPNPTRDWSPVVGAEVSLNKRFGLHWQLLLYGSVNELQDYSEYTVRGEVVYHF